MTTATYPTTAEELIDEYRRLIEERANQERRSMEARRAIDEERRNAESRKAKLSTARDDEGNLVLGGKNAEERSANLALACDFDVDYQDCLARLRVAEDALTEASVQLAVLRMTERCIRSQLALLMGRPEEGMPAW